MRLTHARGLRPGRCTLVTTCCLTPLARSMLDSEGSHRLMIMIIAAITGQSCCQTNCQTRTPVSIVSIMRIRCIRCPEPAPPPRCRHAAARPLPGQPARKVPAPLQRNASPRKSLPTQVHSASAKSAVLQGRGEAGILREEHCADDVHRDALQEQRHVGAEARRAGHPDDRHEQAPSVRHLQPSQPFNASISTRQTSDTRVQEQPRVQSARATTERRCTA